MSEPFKVSLKRQSKEVFIESESGVESKYQILEFEGTHHADFMNALQQKSRTNEAGDIVGVKDMRGYYAELISRCLFLSEPNGKLTPVSKTEIQKWRPAAQEALFLECLKVCRLDKASREEASVKNE